MVQLAKKPSFAKATEWQANDDLQSQKISAFALIFVLNT
jgi:hypothetical protein